MQKFDPDFVRHAHLIKMQGITLAVAAAAMNVPQTRLREAQATTPLCIRCECKLREMSADGLCGFCQVESVG